MEILIVVLSFVIIYLLYRLRIVNRELVISNDLVCTVSNKLLDVEWELDEAQDKLREEVKYSMKLNRKIKKLSHG